MICIPIISKKEEALKDIKIASRSADLVELRTDLIKGVALEELILKSKKPVIVTNRKEGEGGKAKNDKSRILLLKKAIKLNADFIDIEFSSGKKAINQLKKFIKKNKKKTKLIVSYHHLKETPRNLDGIYKKIKKLNPDIIKIATFANSINDNIKIFDLIKLFNSENCKGLENSKNFQNKAKREKKKIIALCMGEKGEVSRILSVLFGSYLTFASLKKGKESAHGQLTVDELKDVYRVDKLKNPKIFGLVGNPVSHSKSYLLHNQLFKKLNLNAIYINFLVDNLKGFIKNFKKYFDGLSVTIPYKTEIIRYLDKIDNTAKKIGAVNTVIKKNKRLVGYNTDFLGAIKAIKSKTTIKDKNIAIIGAGGVARAIAFGIVKEKGKLTILNRTVNKARILSKELNCNFKSLEQIKSLKNVDILINATSVGMNKNKTPIKKQFLKKIMKKNAVVFDSVYTPPTTKLLRDANSLNYTIISGLDMFINQAELQSQLWTGKKVSISENYLKDYQ